MIDDGRFTGRCAISAGLRDNAGIDGARLNTFATPVIVDVFNEGQQMLGRRAKKPGFGRSTHATPAGMRFA